MIFQEISKLKRTSIMTSVIMIAVGILMIICPDNYMSTMIAVLGSVMLIFAVIGVLDYFDSNKAMIHYFYLTGWIIVGIIGFAILFFQLDAMFTISWLFGVFLILTGLSNISSAFTYVKRSGVKVWWVLVILALVLVVCGVIILVNPWWGELGVLFKVVGCMMLFSSLVSILRLIWLWPIKSE